MNRRDFIKSVAIGVGAVSVPLVIAAKTSKWAKIEYVGDDRYIVYISSDWQIWTWNSSSKQHPDGSWSTVKRHDGLDIMPGPFKPLVEIRAI